jgi:putative phage-type endonuclease
MKIVELQQDTPEWLAWRLKHITASNAAAIIGWDKYRTAYQVWCEMTLRSKGFAGNAYTDAGKAMEPKARACYEVEHDFAEMKPACIEHPVHGQIGASLDGLRMPDYKVILECKYPSEESHNLAKSGEVPKHYIPQCQHQLMCAPETEELHYWSFRDEKGVKVVVRPDPIFQAHMLSAELAFWDLVKSDTPPPLTEKDVKVVENKEIVELCSAIELGKDSMPKAELDAMKAMAIKLAGHPKMKCGNVQISTVLRQGKFSFHKLTIGNAG